MRNLILPIILLFGCESVDPYWVSEDAGIHRVSYSSMNMVIIRYNATSRSPNLTNQAIDMAREECAFYGRKAVHAEGEVFKEYGFNEKHTFNCEAVTRKEANYASTPQTLRDF